MINAFSTGPKASAQSSTRKKKQKRTESLNYKNNIMIKQKQLTLIKMYEYFIIF